MPYTTKDPCFCAATIHRPSGENEKDVGSLIPRITTSALNRGSVYSIPPSQTPSRAKRIIMELKTMNNKKLKLLFIIFMVGKGFGLDFVALLSSVSAP